MISRGFKALKQQIKIFLQLGRFLDALGKYEHVLHYTHSVATRNYAEKSICSILDRVSAATSMPLELVEAWFSQTQNTLCVSQTDRLRTKIGLKLARLWLARREWDRLARVRTCFRHSIYAYTLGAWCCLLYTSPSPRDS